MSLRLVLADDHAVVRDGLRALLQAAGDLEVVGEAGDGRRAVELARALSPDVVVMDIGLPGLNGLDATRELTAGRRGPKVLVLSTYLDQWYVQAALRAGATGYVCKSSAAELLAEAIRAVAAGRRFFSPEVSQFVDAAAEPTGEPLTAREREVLRAVAQGLTTSGIAAELYVSVKTVESHRRNIMRKLRLHGVAELTKYAMRHGLSPT